MTPLTQMLAAAALSAVIAVALWQSSRSGVTVGNFVAFVTAMLMLVAPIRHLAEIAGSEPAVVSECLGIGRGIGVVAEMHARPKSRNLRPLLRLTPYLRRYKARIVMALVALLAAAGATLAVPIGGDETIGYRFTVLGILYL